MSEAESERRVNFPVGRRRLLVGFLIGMLAVACLLGFISAWRPAFYVPSTDPDAPRHEQAARRLVTQLSAVHGGLGRPCRWGAVIADEEVNAWLDLEVPRNHPTLLPASVRRPLVAFEPKRIKAAARVGYGIASAVAWIDAEVALREINQLEIAVVGAGIGPVPVSRGLVLREIANRISPLGAVTELRQVGGRPVLLVYIPSVPDGGMTSRLEGLRIDDGEMVVEGMTRSEKYR
jgi:hypothetical protein